LIFALIRELPEFRQNANSEGGKKVPGSKIKVQKRLMKKRAKTYTISAVAEQFEIHPQTLRLYEREGLLKPSRSEGNTRLYTDPDLERLEIILSLTRDLGVNLAGVEIILNMREKMDAMQREFERFFQYLQSHAEEFSHFTDAPPPEAGALVAINRPVPARRRAATGGKSGR
jgi:MerR family transcriptional regulator/heat shock protein HspR